MWCECERKRIIIGLMMIGAMCLGKTGVLLLIGFFILLWYLRMRRRRINESA